ncbi:MAG: NADH-quinone oxidoreductase subunit C [Planctomycetota bacterium]
MAKFNLDHPTLPLIKSAFPDSKLFATEFRGETTLVVEQQDLHGVLSFLHHDTSCIYDFLSDIAAVDYLKYPKPNQSPEGMPTGRFGVVYNLLGTGTNGPESKRLFLKVLLEPTLPTDGIEEDPALVLPTVTDLWPGAEWMEREVFDMFGIRFTDHPDLRRILTWESYPAHPLRKDYPVKGRGEREDYRVVDRDSA